ncbi:minor head protein-like protein [Burkholderia phage BcepF1]|uniref:Minor head protein-like protein n=1 Tax=Burkholderia phage BcepF1 TaxID=2886897 RepID=A1Z028_9CAUD|nr:minor head protein [Burkholderia phage BcepF1]ABL96855.1 minor head protein-like protein [Burkholderia phage BcepF1]
MFKKLFKRFLIRQEQSPEPTPVEASIADEIPRHDPLDPLARTRQNWPVQKEKPNPIIRSVKDFPFVEISDSVNAKSVSGKNFAMDSAVRSAIKAITGFAMDDGGGAPVPIGAEGKQSSYAVPEALQDWYLSQGFIGHQACALIAQHWLVDKACSLAGEDAIRNGWHLKSLGEGEEIDEESLEKFKAIDVEFKVKENLIEFNRFKNVFGIRVAIFVVDSEDPDYYEKPFNPDGITPGSYRGISQIDPYWMMPMLTAESTADPSSQFFYEPEFWIISGQKYHRSHLIIARGPQPADILKPTYIFGGIPLVQRIYERVYAAERTANEAPLLAMNKRTTAIHTDTAKAIANEDKFIQRLMFWVRYRDNHAVKVLGTDETMEQFDTSLADFDAVIMGQYQLVASIAKTPATKLLGTAPKGFNSTGEFETISYHEELESIQEHVYMPFLQRHYLISRLSLGIQHEIDVVMEPVASMTAQQQADLNKTKAEGGKVLIDGGVISPDEERNRIRDDKRSGYNRLTKEDAEETPGASPENLAAYQKAGAAQETASAKETQAGAAVTTAEGDQPNVQMVPSMKPGQMVGPEVGITAPMPEDDAPVAGVVAKLAELQQAQMGAVTGVLARLVEQLDRMHDRTIAEGADIGQYDASGRTVKPGTIATIRPSVSGNHVGEQPTYQLPKMKMNGRILRIENPRGTVRSGISQTGDAWSVNMPHHYGFISGVKGYDGDELDCFVGPNTASKKVFVVNQKDKEGAFDEHKCMLGFDDFEQAKEAYNSAFRPGWDGFDSMFELDWTAFDSWMTSGNVCTGPYTNEWVENMQGSPQMKDESENGDVEMQNQSREETQTRLKKQVGGDPNDPASPILPEKKE